MTLFRPPAGYMRISDISELLKCSEVTIWKYRNKFDDFPPPVRFMRRLLFERGAVMAWCRRHIEDYHDGASRELADFDQEFEVYERDCMAALRDRCREAVEDATRGCDAIRERMVSELTAAVRAEVARCLDALDLRRMLVRALEEVIEDALPSPARPQDGDQRSGTGLAACGRRGGSKDNGRTD